MEENQDRRLRATVRRSNRPRLVAAPLHDFTILAPPSRRSLPARSRGSISSRPSYALVTQIALIYRLPSNTRLICSRNSNCSKRLLPLSTVGSLTSKCSSCSNITWLYSNSSSSRFNNSNKLLQLPQLSSNRLACSLTTLEIL